MCDYLKMTICSMYLMFQSNWDEVVDNFDEMGLREELLRGVYAYGFEKPSAIQQRAIIPCIKGYDVIAQAQSGTGKTATFAVTILQQLEMGIKECQALVLAPTRELAQQVRELFRQRTFTCTLSKKLNEDLVTFIICKSS